MRTTPGHTSSRRVWMGWLGACAAGLSVPGLGRAAPTIQLVYAEEFAPYSFTQEGRMGGILVQILDELLVRRLKLSVEHHGYPWARAQMMVQSGQADAFVTVPTDERRAYTVPNGEWITQGKLTLFTRADHPRLAQLSRIRKITDLKEVSVGSYLGNSWVKSKFAGMEVQYATSRDGALRMLQGDRFDVMVDAANPTRQAIKAAALERSIVELPAVLDVSETRLCIGKHSELLAYLKQIDAAVRDMKADGTLARLSAGY